MIFSDIKKIDKPLIDKIRSYQTKEIVLSIDGTRPSYFWRNLNEEVLKVQDQHITLRLDGEIKDWKNFSFFKFLTNLKSIHLNILEEIDISCLLELENIDQIKISGICWNQISLRLIEPLKKRIKIMSLEGNISQPKILGSFENIKYLSLHNSCVTDFQFLKRLRILERLIICNNQNLIKIDCIKYNQNLKYLELCNLPKIDNLDFVVNLGKLQFLHIKNLSKLRFLPEWNNSENIKRISLEGISSDFDLSNIVLFQSTEEIAIYNSSISSEDVLPYLAVLPNLKTVYLEIENKEKALAFLNAKNINTNDSIAREYRTLSYPPYST